MNEDQIHFRDFSGDGEILYIDKPLDWTSFDVVKKVRVLFNVRKVGHAGALDPKATGLLIVCTGRKTKSIDQFVGLEKEYYGVCEIGVRTPSFDSETEIHEYKDTASIADQIILNVADSFLGKQMQIPPMYSAVKYGGMPLYRYARAGRTVERIKREIDIVKFEIQRIRRPLLDFCIVCSKGTYVRSLIDEFGIRLGCGAMLSSLRRSRIGSYHLSQAMTIDQLVEWRKTYFAEELRGHEARS
jgi:tRNA pseudouridine55 synthase